MDERVQASPEQSAGEAAKYRSLLATGERVLLVQRRHWFTFLEAGRWFVLALVAGVAVSAVNASIPDSGIAGPLSTLLGYAFALFILVGVAGIGWYVLVWLKERYLVTTRRVIETGGLVNRYSRDTSLSMITDMVVSNPWLGRIFGYGDIELLTASDAGMTRIRFLKDADDFKRALLDAKHEYQLELSGGARAAAPAVAPPPAAAAAAPQVQPSPPAEAAPAGTAQSASISAAEMDQALTHLGDLRERGLLTEEEFQAKKKEFLDRL